MSPALGRLTDAWATALSVLPFARACTLARDLGLMVQLVTREGQPCPNGCEGRA